MSVIRKINIQTPQRRKESVCAQLKTVLQRVYNNFDNLQQHGGRQVRRGGHQKLLVSERRMIVLW